MRIARNPLVAAVSASETLRDTLMIHADAFTARSLQVVACNALHSVEERLARWLLTAMDRSGKPTLPITHRALAMRPTQRTEVDCPLLRELVFYPTDKTSVQA
jgi:hypothetical protein